MVAQSGGEVNRLMVKAEHRMDRTYLKGHDGDRANAVLAAAVPRGHAWVRILESALKVF